MNSLHDRSGTLTPSTTSTLLNMSSLNYVAIPPGARRLKDADDKETENVRPLPIRTTSLPHPQPDDSPTTPGSPLSPTKNSALNLLPSLLLSSTLPSTPQHARKPSKSEKTPLLSVKDPLSIQITTSNFKRFIERVGPVFWIQDRVEEIVMWRRGWKVTTTWIAAYVLICTAPFIHLRPLTHIHRLLSYIATCPPTGHSHRHHPCDL